MAEFKMPSLGADMESGVLVEWKVKVGDVVRRGDVVAVVETDKGAIDVEIFEDGVIEALLVPADTTVPVGTVLARLQVEHEAMADAELAKPGGEIEPAHPSATASAATSPSLASGAPEVASVGRAVVSPRARKRAGELGIGLEGVVGTGPQGSVTAEDVERAAAARSITTAPATATMPPVATSAAPVVAPTARTFSMRAAIAAAMSRSKREIPHYYLAHTIDLEPALRWLEGRNAAVPIAARVLPVALLVRAVARALREFPELCGSWQDGAFVPSPGIHVGVAVSLRDGGLVNPAIHHADQGAIEPLFERIRDVSRRARAGQLRSSELSDAAITITSLGDRGVDAVFGVIHPPQVAIVGVGTIAPRPWVVDDRIEARRVVTLSLSADHRVSDGHRGGRFLRLVERHLEAPGEL
jgi:pyruvate dehydrogenase E2 component (dihydrolipoamide acetyltransferase)